MNANQSLWYRAPATCWNEALPLGNGRLGAMVDSGAAVDRLWLNEDTLWAGLPGKPAPWMTDARLAAIRAKIAEKKFDEAQELLEDAMPGVNVSPYLSAGDLRIEILDEVTQIRDYTRALDLDTATLTSAFTARSRQLTAIWGGIPMLHAERECFVSAPDQVLAYRLRLSRKASVRIALTCDYAHTTASDAHHLLLDAACPRNADQLAAGGGVQYRMAAYIDHNGTAQPSGAAAVLSDVTECTVYLAICSSFRRFDLLPDDETYADRAVRQSEHAASVGFDALRARHVADYQSLFRRVSLELGDPVDAPTDARIESPANDPHLAALLFDYGRYLLIACSRAGTQAANLQGIWTDRPISPWASDYTMNINTQMNYWPAEPCALPECHEPMIQLVRELASQGNCMELPGWASWHNSDLWRASVPVTKNARWGFWPMGGAWSCRHLWEHYEYSRDEAYLRSIYPIFTGALDFLRAWVIRGADGKFTTAPSTSPENAFLFRGKEISTGEGSAMDLSIIADLCSYTRRASEILGEDFSPYASLADELAPLRIGSDGRLLEWADEFPEPEPGHRHVSHLYGLYPARTIPAGSPLFDAACKSLAYRIAHGGGYTGWSNAWLACLFARLRDGESAWARIQTMFQKSIYPNLLDAHPPFQIDGNFGITAAIAEMLLQSTDENGTVVLHILPACPEEWPRGSVRGLRAPGGLIVDIAWTPGGTPTVSVQNPLGIAYRIA